MELFLSVFSRVCVWLSGIFNQGNLWKFYLYAFLFSFNEEHDKGDQFPKMLHYVFTAATQLAVLI